MSKKYIYIILGMLFSLYTFNLFNYKQSLSREKSVRNQLFLEKDVNLKYSKALSDISRFKMRLNDSLTKKIFNKSNAAYALVFRYKYNMCESCIVKGLANIKRITKDNCDHNCYILPSYEINRSDTIAMQNRLETYRFSNIPFHQLHLLEIHDLETPYYFVIDNRGYIHYSFYPRASEEFDKRMMDYLCMKYLCLKQD